MPEAKKKNNIGFTLVEVLVGVGVFVVLFLSVYQTYMLVLDSVSTSRTKITATALATEQFEIARNLPYNEVGTVGGIPNGKIPHSQVLTRDGKNFTITTTIRSIDNPFDGTIGDTPNDLSPADSKLIELEITCNNCKKFQPLIFTTQVGPKDLESESTNGSLFIKVFDANGQEIPDALIHIENNQVFPSLQIDDNTNNEGELQIVDAPPGAEAYEITVSKPGYSTERTYLTGSPTNPNPTKPNATVALRQLTQMSFSIDRASDLNISSTDELCNIVPEIGFSLKGTKLIGNSPDILKQDISDETDDTGKNTIEDLDWDSYVVSISDDAYDMAGTIPLTPLILNSDSIQDLKLIVSPKKPNSLLITVKDASTGLPLSGSLVGLTYNSSSTSLTTGRGFMRQTDWSGGSAQDNFEDQTKYFYDNGNIEINDPAGAIHLKKIDTLYATSSYLISSTFDTGSESNFHQILWQPQNQPVTAGTSSVLIQIATNNGGDTWNFYGPDGTTGSYYTLSNQNISTAHNNDRYLRYKVYLNTEDATVTPTISDISFTFTSACTPPGQAFFTDLPLGNYSLTVTNDGYQDYTDTINLSSAWQEKEVILNP